MLSLIILAGVEDGHKGFLRDGDQPDGIYASVFPARLVRTVRFLPPHLFILTVL